MRKNNEVRINSRWRNNSTSEEITIISVYYYLLNYFVVMDENYTTREIFMKELYADYSRIR